MRRVSFDSDLLFLDFAFSCPESQVRLKRCASLSIPMTPPDSESGPPPPVLSTQPPGPGQGLAVPSALLSPPPPQKQASLSILLSQTPVSILEEKSSPGPSARGVALSGSCPVNVPSLLTSVPHGRSRVLISAN